MELPTQTVGKGTRQLSVTSSRGGRTSRHTGASPQTHPKFDLTELFTKHKIVLVPLNRGVVGSERACLLGSLIVGMTWTLALGRASIPAERRHLVSVYVDELQDYLSLPTDLSDALAQARGLGVGMTLAHQYRDQLPPEVRAGIDANCRNKIVFGLNSKDANDMAAMAPELSAEDFMALPLYQIYTSFQSGGRSTGWVMGKTLPSTPALRAPSVLYTQSIESYGTPAEETATRLSNRDIQVLTAIQRYRYLLTGQIQRLYFTETATPQRRPSCRHTHAEEAL